MPIRLAPEVSDRGLDKTKTGSWNLVKTAPDRVIESVKNSFKKLQVGNKLFRISCQKLEPVEGF
jgi:hypothetical protein